MPTLRELSTDASHIEGTTTSPDTEDILLRPLRPKSKSPTGPPEGFDPGEFDHDIIALELEVAPSMICVYGSLLRNFLHVKVNVSPIRGNLRVDSEESVI